MKKVLLIVAALWIVVGFPVVSERSVSAAGSDAVFKLAAMQMPEGSHEHSEDMPGMEGEMTNHDGHEMAAVSEKDASLHTEEHRHDSNQTEGHEHQHDQRTMGKPGEGPNWPLIEGFAFFNILVLIGAGFMKWKKKENVQ